MNHKQRKILIIGRPNSGKTHFDGQLYLKLIQRDGRFKASVSPTDISLINDVTSLLYRGLSADHTNVQLNRELPISIEDGKGDSIMITIPEYGGEQVNEIVKNRKLTVQWQSQLNESDSWLLFIKLDDLVPIEDIINRGLPDVEEIKKRQLSTSIPGVSDQAFFVELLQMLLHKKGVSPMKYLINPKLTVILSCWDLLDKASRSLKPSDLLEKKMPLLFQFLKSTWNESLQVLGLSSTEKTLDPKTPDGDYVEKGPEAFGYVITPDGKKENDLTAIISILFRKL